LQYEPTCHVLKASLNCLLYTVNCALLLESYVFVRYSRMTHPDTFAFVIHPIDPKRHIGIKYPLLGKLLTERQIDSFCQFWPPVYLSQIDGIRSQATGREITGWFVAAPYTPRAMLRLPVKQVYRKLVQTGHLAEKLGARIMGLGAFTS